MYVSVCVQYNASCVLTTGSAALADNNTASGRRIVLSYTCFRPHLYADDTQVYFSCRPFAVTDFQLRLSACVDDIAAWMLANRLQLNTGKTDLLWCATSRRRRQLPTSALRIGSDLVKTVSQRSRNLLWRRPQHAIPDSENSCQLLRRFTPTAQYSTVSSNVSIPHARRRSRLVTARLRQCCAGGLNGLPVQPSAVSAQRCCAIHRRSTTLRPHHRHTRQFPLVEGPGAYLV